MNIDQTDLDHWRAYLEQLRITSLDTLAAIEAGHVTDAARLVRKTAASAARMGLKLEAAGAQRPASLPAPPEVPIHLLDTSANRRYVDYLHAARDAGLAVDRERGYADGAGPRASMIGMLLETAEMEVHGPAGGGLE